jgi:hypothetical protein
VSERILGIYAQIEVAANVKHRMDNEMGTLFPSARLRVRDLNKMSNQAMADHSAIDIDPDQDEYQ